MLAGAPSFSQSVAPGIPSLTIGAEMKGLRFDWEPVEGASWYQLEIKANENAEFVQHGDDIDASTLFTRKGSFNFNHNAFPSIEALLKKAAAAPSAGEAGKLYQQLAMETAEQAPLGAVTNFGEAYYAYNPKLVANMRFTVFQVYPFIGGLRPPAS